MSISIDDDWFDEDEHFDDEESDDEDYYDGLDVACAKCDGSTIGETCGGCGAPLCPRCFETSAGYHCAPAPSALGNMEPGEDWRP